MNEWLEHKKKTQDAINALPLHWAFGNDQFLAEMALMGLDPEKDMDKICKGPGGSFILVTDAKLVANTLVQITKDRKALLDSDKTGEGVIFQMFLQALSDTEYGYTFDPEDALSSLNMTMEEVEADRRLSHGFMKACDMFCN